MSDLFEFINGMVAKPAEFKKTKMHERGKHFFMVNRLCSIAFPVQASAFNHIKINGGQAVSFWQTLLSQKYSRTPKWMYVSTRKEKEKKKAQQPVSDEIIRKYCETYQLSRRDIDDALTLLPESTIQELKSFESLTQQ
jgi:hypothetical protein